jgi:hypothetical protein
MVEGAGSIKEKGQPAEDEQQSNQNETTILADK